MGLAIWHISMTDSDPEIDPEIDRLIEKYADEENIPADALRDIYRSERNVVNMELRRNIHNHIKSTIEEYADA